MPRFAIKTACPPQSACPCEDVRQDVGAVLHTNPTKGQERGMVTNRPQQGEDRAAAGEDLKESKQLHLRVCL